MTSQLASKYQRNNLHDSRLMITKLYFDAKMTASGREGKEINYYNHILRIAAKRLGGLQGWFKTVFGENQIFCENYLKIDSKF